MTVLPDDHIDRTLAERLPAWRREDGHLVRTFETGGWQRTLLLANALAFVGEAAWHHPDLLLTYPRLVVRLTTHDAGGITEKDLALAEAIERTATWRPDAPLGGPDAPVFR